MVISFSISETGLISTWAVEQPLIKATMAENTRINADILFILFTLPKFQVV